MTGAPGDISGLPRPPERPDDGMCCQRGCCPCIFDYYHDALARWQVAVREAGRDPDAVLARFDQAAGC